MKASSKGWRVEEGQTKLDVSHINGILTFTHPFYGPDTYANVQSAIEHDGLEKPTFTKNVSLVQGAFHANEEILTKQTVLWCSTGLHYVPEEGVYIENHPFIRESMPYMEKGDLVRKLETNDPLVKFVPFGFKVGKMSVDEFVSNPLILALAEESEEQVYKLAEIAGRQENKKPHLFGFTSVEEPRTMVAVLYVDWLDRGLWIGGDRGSNKGGFGRAYGIQKTGLADHI